MINNWWVTRPKRKLVSVPEELAVIASAALNKEWQGDRALHLQIEKKLEDAGLKREGDRRDQGGGGARTYVAWLKSLGLLFSQNATKQLQLTLAGEELLNGRSPTLILTKQIFKYQFPSPFSISRGVAVNPRFHIRPFRFLFRLLLDERLEYLTQDEIAKIVVTEAENETDRCYEKVVERVLEFREKGDACLPSDFEARYPSSRAGVKTTASERLNDVANTVINWAEYTQLVSRDTDGKVRILPDARDSVMSELMDTTPFMSRWEDEEYFQRKFGVDPWHSKDLRNLTKAPTISASVVAKASVRKAFLALAAREPILGVTSDLIARISSSTGLSVSNVEDIVRELFPRGAFGSFLPSYNEMAFTGRDKATEFEVATKSLFESVFGFRAKHVGPIGKTPDVLILSDADGYQAIIDNKAYAEYTISNDHKNRMVVNYISGLSHYSSSPYPLAFFTYIAGGFGKTIDDGVRDIYGDTGVPGSAMPVGNLIRMMERHVDTPYSHANIRDIFSLNRRVTLADVERLP